MALKARMLNQPTMQRCHCDVPCRRGREAKRPDCRVRQHRLGSISEAVVEISDARSRGKEMEWEARRLRFQVRDLIAALQKIDAAIDSNTFSKSGRLVKAIARSALGRHEKATP